ncbi:MAG: hypothetical protein ACQETD_02395 [Pseudomonadota bacterium]
MSSETTAGLVDIRLPSTTADSSGVWAFLLLLVVALLLLLWRYYFAPRRVALRRLRRLQRSTADTRSAAHQLAQILRPLYPSPQLPGPFARSLDAARFAATPCSEAELQAMFAQARHLLEAQR